MNTSTIHAAASKGALSGGALVGVIIVVLVVVISAILVTAIGAGFFVRWLREDYFALKPTSKDRKASWVEPDLRGYSCANSTEKPKQEKAPKQEKPAKKVWRYHTARAGSNNITVLKKKSC